MQSPFSLLSPFVLCAVSAGFIVLIVASIFLIRDLIKMRREYQAGAPSVWYRRPMTYLSLVGIGFSLLVLLAALEWSFPTPLPFTIFTVSLIGLSMVIDSSRLISDIRNEQQERGEGFPSVWHRRPKTLREIGRLIFMFGLSLDLGYLGYALSQGIPFHWNIIPGIFVPSLFFCLSLVLFIYAAILQMLSRHSS